FVRQPDDDEIDIRIRGELGHVVVTLCSRHPRLCERIRTFDSIRKNRRDFSVTLILQGCEISVADEARSQKADLNHEFPTFSRSELVGVCFRSALDPCASQALNELLLSKKEDDQDGYDGECCCSELRVVQRFTILILI